MDIDDWLQENYPKIWDEWLRAADYYTGGDIEDWLIEDKERFEIWLEFLEDKTDDI